MPAWRLNNENRQVRRFDVGLCDGATEGLLTHAILCVVDGERHLNQFDNQVDAYHMGPPLQETPHSIDVLGTARADFMELSPQERRQIQTFVDDRFNERKAQQERLKRLRKRDQYFEEYVVNPPYAEPDDAASLWRFSCVGFVLRAYQEANIQLVDLMSVPRISLETLKAAYPFRSSLDRQHVRDRLGIGAGNSWPVVLAGYLAHSLARTAEEIRDEPYQPNRDDAFFPTEYGG